MASKSFKKNLSNNLNPALQFISTHETAIEMNNNSHPTVTKTLAEFKSRRLQLLIKPSLYNQVKAMAEACGKSVNDFIHTVLEDFVS